jgi:hypothetical protein
VLRRCCDACEVCSDAHARVYVQSVTFLNLLMTRSAVTHMRVCVQSVTFLNLLMTRSAVTHMRVCVQSVTALVTGGRQ